MLPPTDSAPCADCWLSYSVLQLLLAIVNRIDFGVFIILAVSWLFEVFAAILCIRLQHVPVHVTDAEALQLSWRPGPFMLADVCLVIVRIALIFAVCIPLAKVTNAMFLTGAGVGLLVALHSALSLFLRFKNVNIMRMAVICGKEMLAYGVLTSVLVLYYKR
jgi:hypothetical protein